MLKSQKTFALLLACIVTLLYAMPAAADLFLSAETKAHIAKAESGDARSALLVAAAYDRGVGAPQDRTTAMKWYRMAAEAGSAEAENSIGSMLQDEKKYVEALSWYEKAAAGGHAQAVNSMAYLYDLGLGVPQDRKKGFDLYLRAADMGFAEAMWNIAIDYGGGQLGSVDLVMACVWANRAVRFAGPREERLLTLVNKTLPRLEDRLGKEQLNSCRQQADSWTPAAIKP